MNEKALIIFYTLENICYKCDKYSKTIVSYDDAKKNHNRAFSTLRAQLRIIY